MARAREVRARGVDLLPGRGDHAGDPPVGVGEGRGDGDVLLEFGDERDGALLAGGEIGGELVDGVLQQHRLRDRLLGGADADGGFAAVARADRRLGGGELLVGERDPLARLLGVVGDRRERLGRVGRCERLQARGGGIEGCRGLASRLLHARECLGGVLLELAQLVERLGLLIEPRVRLLAQGDDAGVPGPDSVLGVGGRVVELLLEGEGLREVLLRGGERLLELGGRGIAELRLRELELLRARLDRVIGLDEGGCRSALELLRGDLLDRRAAARAARRPASCAGCG